MSGVASTTCSEHPGHRSRRRTIPPRNRLLAAIGGTVLIHVGLALIVSASLAATVTFHALIDEPRAPVVALQSSCVGDAYLAATAGAALCATPFLIGDSCLHEVSGRLALDLDRCRGAADPSPVEFSFLDQKAMRKITSIDPEQLVEEVAMMQPPPQPPPPPPVPQQATPPPPPPPAPARPQQVIETVKPDQEVEPPDNTRFLSDYNSHVERQKVARGSRAEEMVNKPKPEELAVKPEAKPPTVTESKPEDRPPGLDERAPDAPGKLSMRKPGATAPAETAQDRKVVGAINGSTQPADNGTTARRGDGAVSQERRDVSETPRGETGGGGGAPRVPDLHPTKEVLERVAGGGSVDHVEDVEEGDENAFNTRAWVGASFINRTKRQVAREWDPAPVWLQHDPNGQVYGIKSRLTVLRVTLAPDGRLLKTVVIKASGVDFLDDEAMRAFKAAAPFPNPPDVLRDKDGLITFTFGFYFEIGSRKSWKIFRTL